MERDEEGLLSIVERARLVVLTCVILTLLFGCARPTVVEERVRTVSVPVTVPCVAGERPAPAAPLQGRFSRDAWQRLTLKQKAELVAAQGLRHQQRSEQLDAATGACR